MFFWCLLLLILNIFHTFFITSALTFEQVNVYWDMIKMVDPNFSCHFKCHDNIIFPVSNYLL